MGLRTIPPDAWEFDSRIPERGTNTFTEEAKLAAITFYIMFYTIRRIKTSGITIQRDPTCQQSE